MKNILFLLFLGTASVVVSAQNSPAKGEPAKPSLSIDAVTAPAHLSGTGNYLLSFTDKDFSAKNYIFYTDSSATVAHLQINGNEVRLTGGHNPENIMTYVDKDYTVTLDVSNNSGSAKVDAMLVIYSKIQKVGKNVTGMVVN